MAKKVLSDKPKNDILTSLLKFLHSRNLRGFSHSARIYLKRRLTDIPDAVLIEPINTCNLSCPLCTLPQSHLNRKRQTMSYKDFKYIVSDLRNHTQAITFSMAGEPLLNTEIVGMVSYATSRGLHVTLDTNATLLTPKIAKGLIESGLDVIYASLDGCSKESHESFRVNSNFQETFQNIATLCFLKRTLGEVTPIVVLECIAYRLNENELSEVKEMSKRIGVDRFWIKSLGIPSHIYGDDICKKMADKYLPSNSQIKSRYAVAKKTSCTFWTRNTVILVDGTVTMCCMDINGDYSFGNVFRQKFIDIWNSDKYRYYRKILIPKMKLPICSRCPGKG